MVDIEKAISYIQNMDLSVFKDTKEACEAVDLITEILEKQLNNGWIPIDKGLPTEYNKEYLVIFDNGQVSCLLYDNEKDWVDIQWCHYTDKVIAWQPLPPKYEVKNEN